MCIFNILKPIMHVGDFFATQNLLYAWHETYIDL